MGLLKDSLKLVNELVTLGGAGRLEMARAAYEESYETLQSLHTRANDYKTRINDAVAAVGLALTNVRPHLEHAEMMIRSRVRQRRDLEVAATSQTLHRMEKFNAGMNAAISVGVGSIAGGTMAVGAWSLVAVLGSASTGAAISSLSGIAATNATLAWFGGGALAAGGAGMSGGVAVLGGIVAAPLIYLAARSTHKKAKEFEDERVKVEEEIESAQKELETLPSILEVIQTKRRAIERLCDDAVTKIAALKKVIRPLGPLSTAKQRFLTLVGKQPHSSVQLDAIAELTDVLAAFLAAFDSHVSDHASGSQVALR